MRFTGELVDEAFVSDLTNAMRNRRGDTQGTWVESGVGLGAKVLWTTPESLNEKQPLCSDDSRYVLVSDAIIDNRNELADKLGVSRSDLGALTDPDLILLSYRKWSKFCVDHLVGDFVFVIFDREEGAFFCCA